MPVPESVSANFAGEELVIQSRRVRLRNTTTRRDLLDGLKDRETREFL